MTEETRGTQTEPQETPAEKSPAIVKALKKIIAGSKISEKLSDNDIRSAIKGNSATSQYRKPRKKP